MKTFILLLALATAIPSSSQDLRLRAAKIKAVDVDHSLAFYRDVLGLRVLSEGPDVFMLDGVTMDIVLEKAQRPATGSYPEDSRTILVFQTSDVLHTMERLRRGGVELVGGDEAVPYGLNQETGKPLGLSTKFRDPSGIVHSLVEEQMGGEKFEGVRVYNIGFYLPDIQAARKLYCDALGFVALTEKYLPTAIPVANADGSFAFMLHTRPNLKPSSLRYPEDAQSMIVYESSDLDATIRLLDAHDVERLHDRPQTRSGERFVAFRDPSGNVSEIVEGR